MLPDSFGRLLATLALVGATCIFSTASAGDWAVDDFVGRVNATVGSLEPGDAAGARAACARLVDQAFDIDAMAPAASAGAWPRMSAAQKTAYRNGLAQRIASDCVPRSLDFAGQAMELVGVRQGEGGDRFVAVRAKGKTVIWQVRGSSRLRAIDVSANGRSLVIAAQRDAKAILKNSGGDLQALINSVGR